MSASFWWVVLSNAAYAVPLVWLVAHRRTEDAVHGVLVALVLVTSTLYHVCDPAVGTAGAPLYCVLQFVDLYMLDLALALLLAVSVCTFRIPAESVWVRECALLLTLCLTLYVNFASSAGYNSPGFYLVGVLIGALVLAHRAWHETFALNAWFWASLSLAAVAFTFFGLDTRFLVDYLDLHGCWHLCSGLAVAMIYEWYETEKQQLSVSGFTPFRDRAQSPSRNSYSRWSSGGPPGTPLRAPAAQKHAHWRRDGDT